MAGFFWPVIFEDQGDEILIQGRNVIRQIDLIFASIATTHVSTKLYYR